MKDSTQTTDDIFSYSNKYPNTPGFAKGRRTSRRAAETVW